MEPIFPIKTRQCECQALRQKRPFIHSFKWRRWGLHGVAKKAAAAGNWPSVALRLEHTSASRRSLGRMILAPNTWCGLRKQLVYGLLLSNGLLLPAVKAQSLSLWSTTKQCCTTTSRGCTGLAHTVLAAMGWYRLKLFISSSLVGRI